MGAKERTPKHLKLHVITFLVWAKYVAVVIVVVVAVAVAFFAAPFISFNSTRLFLYFVCCSISNWKWLESVRFDYYYYSQLFTLNDQIGTGIYVSCECYACVRHVWSFHWPMAIACTVWTNIPVRACVCVCVCEGKKTREVWINMLFMLFVQLQFIIYTRNHHLLFSYNGAVLYDACLACAGQRHQMNNIKLYLNWKKK